MVNGEQNGEQNLQKIIIILSRLECAERGLIPLIGIQGARR